LCNYLDLTTNQPSLDQYDQGLLNGDEIAVKKLFPVHGVDDVAFENEFRNIKKVQHKNVIRMIGYCYEKAHRDVEYQGKLVWSEVIDRAICFEYMKGGSLATHISGIYHLVCNQ
jgi:serine/threonine protein kinase